MSGAVKVRYVNVTVDVQLSGADTTVDQLLARPGLKQSLHVESTQPMGLVAERARTHLLHSDSPVADINYVMVPVWRAEIEWQNGAGVRLNSAVVQYLPEEVPTAAQLIDDLKQQFGIVTGHYALRRRPDSLSESTKQSEDSPGGLIPKADVLKSGRYILCPSVHYRLRFRNACPSRVISRAQANTLNTSEELKRTTPVVNHVEEDQHQQQESNSSAEEVLLEHEMEIDAAAPMSSEQLTQQVPQLVTTFRFPALFPADMTTDDQDVVAAVQALDTVQSRRITGDAIPAGDYVVLTVYKYVIAKPTRFDARAERRQVLFYLQPQTMDTLLSDVRPRVDKSQHLLCYNRKSGSSTTTTRKLKACPTAVAVEASALVLEQVIPFTVIVPALNEKLSVPLSPDATVSDMLLDTNLLPLTASGQNPPQGSKPTTGKTGAGLAKMVVLARGFDPNTQMLIDILSPVTLAQDIGTSTLFAGWDYALEFNVHTHTSSSSASSVKPNTSHCVIKVPVSDSFDSVRKLSATVLLSSEDDDSRSPRGRRDTEDDDRDEEHTPQLGLFAGAMCLDDAQHATFVPDRRAVLTELSGPTSRGKRLGTWADALGKKGLHKVHDLWLERLARVELTVPGFTEPQTRWIPTTWTVQNTLRLLHSLFEFEKRGFLPHRQIAMLYVTGTTVPLLDFEHLPVGQDHFSIVFETAVLLDGLCTSRKDSAATVVSAKLLTCDALRLAAFLQGGSTPFSSPLSVCVRAKSKTEAQAQGAEASPKPWEAKIPSQPLFSVEAEALSKQQTMPVFEVSIAPGVSTTLSVSSKGRSTPVTQTICLPAEWTMQDTTRQALTLLGEEGQEREHKTEDMCWSPFLLSNPKRSPLPYTLRLRDLPKGSAGLGFEETKAVAVQTTYQGQSHLFLPLSEKASVQVVLDIAKSHYHLMQEQDFEVMGRAKPQDLLKQHATTSTGTVAQQASFTLELLVRTRVVVYDENDHILFNRTLSANGTVEAIHEAYRAEQKLHPCCTVQFFTKEHHSVVDMTRRHSLFARALMPEDYSLFKGSSSHGAHGPSGAMPSTIVELMAIHHEQKVRVPVYNLHGLGGQPKLINARKFALAGEVAYAASIEYGHANGHSTWSLVPHLSSSSSSSSRTSQGGISLAPLTADKSVDPEQAWDLVETGATTSRRFLAIKLLPSQTEAVLRSSVLLSQIPGLDLRFEDVSITAQGVALQNPHATLASVLPSMQGIVPLYVRAKPDVVATVMLKTGTQVQRLPVRARVADMVTAVGASSESIVTNIVTGKVVAQEELLAHFAPNEFTFSVNDPREVSRVTVRCRGVSRAVEVEESWRVRQLLVATLRTFDMPEAAEQLELTERNEAQQWGLFLPSGKYPLHPKSQLNFQRESSFIIRRRKTKSQGKNKGSSRSSAMASEDDRRERQDARVPRRSATAKIPRRGLAQANQSMRSGRSTSAKGRLVSSTRSSHRASLASVSPSSLTTREEREESTNGPSGHVLAVALVGTVCLAGAAVGLIL